MNFQIAIRSAGILPASLGAGWGTGRLEAGGPKDFAQRKYSVNPIPVG